MQRMRFYLHRPMRPIENYICVRNEKHHHRHSSKLVSASPMYNLSALNIPTPKRRYVSLTMFAIVNVVTGPACFLRGDRAFKWLFRLTVWGA